jgi:alkylated DNA repair dioxygenase AlkB
VDLGVQVMHEFIKGHFVQYTYQHLDDEEWDEPVEREYNGKKIMGRPTQAFGESNFEYAGKLYKPKPWTDKMLNIKLKAEEMVSDYWERDVDFTFCLAGDYPSGADSIPHHSDTVPTLDDLVVSISFGATRLLEWREYGREIKEESNTSKVLTYQQGAKVPYITKRYILEYGDVMIFNGYSQMSSTHAVPKCHQVGRRVNLTFRSGL